MGKQKQVSSESEEEIDSQEYESEGDDMEDMEDIDDDINS